MGNTEALADRAPAKRLGLGSPIAKKWKIAYATPQEEFLTRARDILTRIPSFRQENLFELYASAREELNLYWRDRLENTDTNFNRVPTTILGLGPEDWRDDLLTP